VWVTVMTLQRELGEPPVIFTVSGADHRLGT
jgi:hypothetical protein